MGLNFEITRLDHRVFLLQLHRLLRRDSEDEYPFEIYAILKWAGERQGILFQQPGYIQPQGARL